MIEDVEAPANRDTGGFQPTDRLRNVYMAHVLPWIRAAIHGHDALVIGFVLVQRVKIDRVVSQEYALKGLSQLKHLRIGCAVLIEVRDGDDIVSITAQHLELGMRL